MEPSTLKTPIISSHTIPMDVFMDVVRILLGNTIQWQVESINEKENSLLIQLSIHPHLPRHQKAMENMLSILSDYGYYLKGSPATEEDTK